MSKNKRSRLREEAIHTLVRKELHQQAQAAYNGSLTCTQAINNATEAMRLAGLRQVDGDQEIIRRALVEYGPCGDNDTSWLARHTPAMQRRGA